MHLSTTQCCGLMELAMIRDHKNKPWLSIQKVVEYGKSMMDLHTWDPIKRMYFVVDGGNISFEDKHIPGLLFFTEVERTTYGQGTLADSSVLKGYGKELARYIIKHRLGTVRSSLSNNNRVNHPQHVVRMYVWKPSVAGINKWMLKKQAVREKL